MTQPWTADIAIGPDLAAACINAQFPALAPARLTAIGEGWDNIAFRVNDEFLFRFPRRKVAVPLLMTESKILPWLAPQLPIPIPTPLFLGQPTDAYPHPFTGYRYLPGLPACQANLTDKQRTELAAPLANCLRTLHSTDAVKARHLGIPTDPARLDVSRFSAPARARITDLADRKIIDTDLADRLIDVLIATPKNLPIRTDALVHGDFYFRHLLVSDDPNHSLAAIIDWGDIHLGDPAEDLAIAFTLFAKSARGQFWIAYGIPDNRTYQLAQFRAASGMSWVVHYAADIGDEAVLREAIQSLRHIAD
ncbi:MAG TPA: phosphotransferase [Tepidisphaeraceae bacterium]|jgi:aminoglycoside phosphotransferase (APT) family kinase protein|nr:phosphotransferase [Tepidisphaeraceae bacterium]